MTTCPSCGKQVSTKKNFCQHCGAPLNPQHLKTQGTPVHDTSQSTDRFLTGDKLANRFIILSKIASGGMGVVYRAKDLVLDEVVALKILRTELIENEEMIQRFKRELKVARRIKHPNVCGIYDFWDDEDAIFISMELINGVELSEYMENEDLTIPWITSLVIRIADALKAAHSLNIIHRDLKPSNIMIDSNDQPVIMDFGIARYVGRADFTKHDEVLGTPSYMAPEQFRAEEIDQGVDIYSLGVILFQLLTNRLPFTGMTPLEIALKHMQEMPPDPQSFNKEIPDYLNRTVLTCLEKDPADRFQSVTEIIDALKQRDKQSADEIRNSESRMLQGGMTMKSAIQIATPKKEISEQKDHRSILVADDDKDIVDLIAKTLIRNGYNVLKAYNGREATRIALQNKPDLLCLDVMMPEMDGYQVAEFLLAQPETQHIPIIMITCHTDKEYKSYSKSIGVTAYITKPFDINELMNTVDQVLAK